MMPMQLCYECYLAMGGRPHAWERYRPLEDTARECVMCHLIGIYVRPVPNKGVGDGE